MAKKVLQYGSGVRIISGKHRGRKITVAERDGLRPTPDRVRETVFNWLQPYLPGANVLDAFAGSGVMGLESLSRGASSALFIEQNPQEAQLIRQILQEWGEHHGRVVQGDAFGQHPQYQYDIIFLDPPFSAQLHQQTIDHFANQQWLKKHGRIYIELPQTIQDVEIPSNMEWKRHNRAGRLQYGLIGFQDE